MLGKEFLENVGHEREENGCVTGSIDFCVEFCGGRGGKMIFRIAKVLNVRELIRSRYVDYFMYIKCNES